MKNIVIITTVIKPERTIDLAKSYLADPFTHELYIYDNGHDQDGALILKSINNFDKRAQYINTTGLTLHGQWNKAFEYGVKNHPSNILISNDDLSICDNLVSILSNALATNDKYWIAYPSLYNRGSVAIQVTRGTHADGGMEGCCYMVSSRAFESGVPFIDENFIHWGGDDDIANNVYKHGGKQVRVNEAWINHEQSSTSNSPGFEWVNQAIGKDLEYLYKKWNIRR